MRPTTLYQNPVLSSLRRQGLHMVTSLWKRQRRLTSLVARPDWSLAPGFIHQLRKAEPARALQDSAPVRLTAAPPEKKETGMILPGRISFLEGPQEKPAVRIIHEELAQSFIEEVLYQARLLWREGERRRQPIMKEPPPSFNSGLEQWLEKFQEPYALMIAAAYLMRRMRGADRSSDLFQSLRETIERDVNSDSVKRRLMQFIDGCDHYNHWDEDAFVYLVLSCHPSGHGDVDNLDRSFINKWSWFEAIEKCNQLQSWWEKAIALVRLKRSFSENYIESVEREPFGSRLPEELQLKMAEVLKRLRFHRNLPWQISSKIYASFGCIMQRLGLEKEAGLLLTLANRAYNRAKDASISDLNAPLLGEDWKSWHEEIAHLQTASYRDDDFDQKALPFLDELIRYMDEAAPLLASEDSIRQFPEIAASGPRSPDKDKGEK